MADFETFWTEYPRKVGKGAARKAYQKALELTDAETLLWGARAYKAATEKEDPRFVKHPATWLNQECWEDCHQVKFDWGTANYSGASMKQREQDRQRKAQSNVVPLKP